MASLHISMEMILFITISCHGESFSSQQFAQPPMLPGAHPVMWLCLLHLAMQRHPHKVIFWENKQFPSHMMLKHQRLVNQAPIATLNLTINVNIFLLFYSLFSLPSEYITALPIAHFCPAFTQEFYRDAAGGSGPWGLF